MKLAGIEKLILSFIAPTYSSGQSTVDLFVKDP